MRQRNDDHSAACAAAGPRRDGATQRRRSHVFPAYLPLVLARLPESWKPLARAMTLGQTWTALLLVQATLLLNALWHVSAVILIFNGYAPGLATAVLFNLPAAVYLLRRAAREDWVSRRARWALLPGAFLMHGPVCRGCS